MKNLFKIILFLILVFTGFYVLRETSKMEVKRGMYYWVTSEKDLSKTELEYLKKLKIEKLYVKLFEVERSLTEENNPVEKSEVKLDNYFVDIEIVPVIYIRNSVFKESDTKQLDELAENVVFLADRIYNRNFENFDGYKEIQIDVDWTISTKSSYFYFLRKLKEEIGSKILSATLRLYAFKFSDKMGVLPVDRATLMCYNLLSPIDSENRNSILDLNEIKKYLVGSDYYPLPLDLALPIYSDVQVYHNSTFSGMIYDENPKEMKTFSNVDHLWKKVEKDTLFHKHFLRTGDLLKHESVSVHLLSDASKIIRSNVSSGKFETVSLFHLQEEELKYYSYEELDAVYSFFSR